MESYNNRILRLEKLVIRLAGINGDLANEVQELRREMSGRAVYATGGRPIEDFITESPKQEVKAGVDVHVETAISPTKVVHLYARIVEHQDDSYTRFVVGLDSAGQPVGIRRTHGDTHENVDTIALIEATPERLRNAGWDDQTAPRGPGGSGWKRVS